MTFLLLFYWITYVVLHVHARGPGCCANIRLESCRTACQQLQAQDFAIQRMQLLLTAAESCPSSLTSFWNCVNTTLPAMRLKSNSPDKTCCDFALDRECRRKCHNAKTRESMQRHCQEHQEHSLYTCIRQQEAGGSCCSKAHVTSCGLLCQAIHVTGEGNNKDTRAALSEHCRQDSAVEQCVRDQWQPAPYQNGHNTKLPCCDHGQTPSCRSKCRTLLQTRMPDEDRVDEIINACSEPQVTDPLWQCLLKTNKPTRNQSFPIASVDNAKLQCCGKAASGRCRKLCAQTYKKGWTHKAEFDTSCSYIQPVSTMEADMHNCLTDVDQPCKLGCSGLGFCSNFNNRPTETFRSCTPEADNAAAMTFEFWKRGVIKLPQINIHVKDVAKCNPMMWKAVACALHIKPCSSKQSPITLCKEDCLQLLSQCADTSKLFGDQKVTVPVICNSLPSNGDCVSLKPYLKESSQSLVSNQVFHPCDPNPCPNGEICLLRERECKHLEECPPYSCQAACPLGQNSKVLVTKGTQLRLLETNADMNGDKDCFLSCQCGRRRKIEGCRTLYCVSRNHCQLGHNNIKNNGDSFTMDGRHCVCISGEVICSRTSCMPDSHSPLYTGMPGNCPLRYSPVCAANGKTYPNNCIAACVGVKRVVTGKACSSIDMCVTKPCPVGFKCVSRPQVCLNDDRCPQYECVDILTECNVHHHDPVCDTTGHEFNNMCILLFHRRTLAYRGHCQTSCSMSGVVCGHDGETYSSQCAARAARITVDYPGKCVAFGNLTRKSKPMSCTRVECPPLIHKDCRGVVPPGGCCPICSAVMVLLWSPLHMTATAENMPSLRVSIGDVLNALSKHLTLLHCKVFGYASVNSELVLMVSSTASHPSHVQIRACLGEAKRLHNLFKTRSPSIVSYLSLSPFFMASMDISSVRETLYSNSSYTFPSSHNHQTAGKAGNHAVSSHTQSVPSLVAWLLVFTLTLMHRKCILRL